jgi:hypothetical protein
MEAVEMAYAPTDSRTATVTRRLTTETKSAFKTTEMIAYIAAVVAVVITAFTVDAGKTGGDPFNALDAIRYISYLTIGYMLARGLAKSGSRDRYDAEQDRHRG